MKTGAEANESLRQKLEAANREISAQVVLKRLLEGLE